MVKISYGRYDTPFSGEYQDTYPVWDPDRGRNVYGCRQCGEHANHPFLYYCSRPHKEQWEKENSPPVWGFVRREILKRDAHTCQICGVTKKQLSASHLEAVRRRIREGKRNPDRRWVDYQLEVDHIKPVKTHPDLEFDRANLRVLCHPCHVAHGARPQSSGGPDPLVDVVPLDEFA
ncbi:MAG: HNH endonuclease [Thermoplasmata archaeon]